MAMLNNQMVNDIHLYPICNPWCWYMFKPTSNSVILGFWANVGAFVSDGIIGEEGTDCHLALPRK